MKNEGLPGKNILIVDDHPLNIYALREFLLSIGMQVFEVENGKEAIDFIKSGKAKIDVVLLDMAMPEMDGFETLQKIRNDRDISSLPVFAVTARAMKGDEQKCLEAGATEYVSKPINTKELVAKLEKVLNTKNETEQ